MGRYSVYRLFEQAIPTAVCDEIVTIGLELETKVASVREKPNKDYVDEDVRRTRIAFWPSTHWINGLMSHHIQMANQELWSYHITDTQGVQFGVYEDGGTYHWHKDEFDMPFGDESDGVWQGQARKLSAVINLTDPEEYEGGELCFKDTYGHEISDPEFQQALSQKGSLVVFPSYIVHTVTPVTSGRRCSIVSWMLGDPFR